MVPLLAIIACLLWSTAFVGVKIGLQYSPPLALAGMRFMLSGILLSPFLFRRKGLWRDIREHWKLIGWISLYQTIVLYALFNVGMTMVPGAVGAIIIGSSPLSSAVVAHFFMKGDRMTPMRTVAIVTGVVGVAIIVLTRVDGATLDLSSGSVIGILLLIGATFSSALGNVVYSRTERKPDGLTVTAIQIFMGGLVLFLASFAFETLVPGELMDRRFLGVLLWLATLSALGFTIWFNLLHRPGVRVSDLNVWKFLIPVVGAGLSWIMLPDESPTAGTVIGMICVGCSVVLYQRAGRGLTVHSRPKFS